MGNAMELSVKMGAPVSEGGVCVSIRFGEQGVRKRLSAARA